MTLFNQYLNSHYISLTFSNVMLKVGSATARFLDLRTKVIKWIAAFSSFLRALGLRLIYEQLHY